MMHFRLISTGVYDFPQKARQRIPCSWIAFNYSGLIRAENYDSAGKLLQSFDRTTPPLLILAEKDFITDFEYGQSREDWVLIFDAPELHYDDVEHKMFLDTANGHTELALSVQLSKAEAELIREQIRSIDRDFRTANPSCVERAELMTGALLTRMFVSEFRADDPVERFRSLIDEDEETVRPIAEMCEECGYSRNRMRDLFRARYGISPIEYRQKRRLRRIMHLIVYSGLSVKEIADRVGMKHVTHLYSFLEKNGMEPPRLLCRKYREGMPPSENAPDAP